MIFKSFFIKKALPATAAIVPVYLTVELINGSKTTLPLTSNILLNDAPSIEVTPIPLPAGSGGGKDAQIHLLDTSGKGSGSSGSRSIAVPTIKGKENKDKGKGTKGSDTSTPPKPPAPPPPPPSTSPSTPPAPSKPAQKSDKSPEQQIAELVKSMLDRQDVLKSGTGDLSVMFEILSKTGKLKTLLEQQKQKAKAN